MSASTPLPTPTAAAAQQLAGPRPVAIVPLNAIAKADIAAGASSIDAWLREVSGGYLTLDRLATLAGSVPVIGNIMALVDVLGDLVDIVQKRMAGAAIEFFDWVSLGINLIGVIPAPGGSAARMALRPSLHLIRQNVLRSGLKGVEAIAVAALEVMAANLSEKLMGELDTFLDGALSRLDGVLADAAQTVEALIDDIVQVLQSCIGRADLFSQAQRRQAETVLHDSQHRSRWDSMVAALALHEMKAANRVTRAAAGRLAPEAVAGVQAAIGHLLDVKGRVKGALLQLAHDEAEGGIRWLIRLGQQAVLKRRGRGRVRTAVVPGQSGAKVVHEKSGQPVDSVYHEAPARGDAGPCKLCPAPGATPRSISFATGSETLTHTDFVLAAPLPIAWSRSYRSHLLGHDQASLGARWITPYSTRIDVLGGKGQPRRLLHHGADGRSRPYPWLEVGQRHHDAVEEVTLSRISATLLLLDAGKPLPEGVPSPWRETYELVDTCPGKAAAQGLQHYRLVAQHGQHGAAIGLRSTTRSPKARTPGNNC